MYYDAKECGQRIREQIKLSGYSQEEFAAKVNASLSHTSKVLCGTHGMSIDLLCEIAVVLNVTTDYLLMGKERERVEIKDDLLDVASRLMDVIKKV